MEHDEHQIPIWFFIGSLVGIYGLLIFGYGLYDWTFPPPPDARVHLWGLHADVWWGMLMIVVGTLYTVRFNPWRSPGEPNVPSP